MTMAAEAAPDWRAFADAEALAQALADWTAAHLRAALDQDGRAALAVSGGRTPERFFVALSRRTLDWRAVTVTLVDERWVDETAERSNAALVRRALLQNEAAAARFLPLYRAAPDPRAALPEIEAAIAALPLPFACVVLGMGADGHTASFFPGGDRLAQALDPQSAALVETMRAPGAGEPRVTLTAPLLTQSPIALHIEGAEKRAVLEEALRPGEATALPVRAVLRQDPAPTRSGLSPLAQAELPLPLVGRGQGWGSLDDSSRSGNHRNDFSLDRATSTLSPSPQGGGRPMAPVTGDRASNALSPRVTVFWCP